MGCYTNQFNVSRVIASPRSGRGDPVNSISYAGLPRRFAPRNDMRGANFIWTTDRIGLTDQLFRIIKGAMGNRIKLFGVPKFVERIRLPDEVLRGRSSLLRWAGSYTGVRSGRQIDSLADVTRTGIRILPTKDNRVHFDVINEPLQIKTLDRLRTIIAGRGGSETATSVGGNEPNEPEKKPSIFFRIKSGIRSLWDQYKFGGTHWAFRKTVYNSLKGDVEAREKLKLNKLKSDDQKKINDGKKEYLIQLLLESSVAVDPKKNPIDFVNAINLSAIKLSPKFHSGPAGNIPQWMPDDCTCKK